MPIGTIGTLGTAPIFGTAPIYITLATPPADPSRVTKIYVGHSRAIIGFEQAYVMSAANQIVSALHVEKLIRLIRGHKVLLDADLAKLYGVETRVLIQAVKRNSSRFPADFMFRAMAWSTNRGAMTSIYDRCSKPSAS